MFESTVDTTNRQEMVDFLKNHFRYDTMNSWNQSTSYANNVKLYNLDIPKKYKDKAYELISGNIDMSYYHDLVSDIMDQFNEKTGYGMGFNGRSSGYIVLYTGEYDITKGRTVIYPGRSIDMYEDFDPDEWSMHDLQERVNLVQTFDYYCDKIRDAFLFVLDSCDIVETTETIVVSKKSLSVRSGKTNANH